MSDEIEIIDDPVTKVKNRGETALWKHWCDEVGYDTAFTDDNGVTGPNPEFDLDEWEEGYIEAWMLQQKIIRAMESQHERAIKERGMLDYYKGYEAGLKNAKTHLIKMMVEEDKADAK